MLLSIKKQRQFKQNQLIGLSIRRVTIMLLICFKHFDIVYAINWDYCQKPLNGLVTGDKFNVC